QEALAHSIWRVVRTSVRSGDDRSDVGFDGSQLVEKRAAVLTFADMIVEYRHRFAGNLASGSQRAEAFKLFMHFMHWPWRPPCSYRRPSRQNYWALPRSAFVTMRVRGRVHDALRLPTHSVALRSPRPSGPRSR